MAAPVAQMGCAESIALLYLLHSVPSQPSANPVASFLASQSKHYILPFEKERFLTSTLAFLSSIDDDPNHIPAICVQEDSQAGSLKVFIAVNEAKRGDSHSVLQDLKHGFEGIFSILSRASPTAHNDVFAAVVSMCSKRILCRLRLSGRKTPKLSMKSLLLLSLRPLAKCSSQFTEKAKRAIKLLDSWTNHQTLGRLQNVVQGVYELAQIKGVSELLDAIPNREMDPSSRRSLLNMIKKVARYRSSAMFLCRTAKKFPITQAMEAVPVTLPRSAFQNHQHRSIPSLDSFLKNSGVFYGQKRDHGQFFRLLQCSEQQASDLFVKQTRKTLSEAKIHAEMQLIFHCEIEQCAPFPRVISSSKDACFLCNAFIQMHGKFYTPRCHGRLYPGWRLPICPETTAFEQQFVDYLLAEARNSIQLLLSRRKRSVYPDPNESTVLTIPMSSSTVSCILPATTEAISNPSPELSKTASIIQGVDLSGDTSFQASHLDEEEEMFSQERPRSVQSNGVKSSLASSKSTSEAEARPENDDSRASKRETARAIGHINYLPCSAVDLVPLRLTSKDLPFHQRVTMDQMPIQLSYGMLTFLFEFGTVRHGRMSITQQDTTCVGTTAPINVWDIPTHGELKVGCSKGASRFSIFISTSAILSFEFVWCEAEAISELLAD